MVSNTVLSAVYFTYASCCDVVFVLHASVTLPSLHACFTWTLTSAVITLAVMGTLGVTVACCGRQTWQWPMLIVPSFKKEEMPLWLWGSINFISWCMILFGLRPDWNNNKSLIWSVLKLYRYFKLLKKPRDTSRFWIKISEKLPLRPLWAHRGSRL